MKIHYLILSSALLFTVNAHADKSTLDAAIGAGIGAAMGNELGGRNGAILGGAVGAAVGTSGSNSKEKSPAARGGEVRYGVKAVEPAHPGFHCPPGQAKKGRC